MSKTYYIGTPNVAHTHQGAGSVIATYICGDFSPAVVLAAEREDDRLSEWKDREKERHTGQDFHTSNLHGIRRLTDVSARR